MLKIKVLILSAWARVAQLAGGSSWMQKVLGLIPGQGTCLGCRFHPQPKCAPCSVQAHPGGPQPMLLSHMDVPLSSFLSLKAIF